MLRYAHGNKRWPIVRADEITAIEIVEIEQDKMPKGFIEIDGLYLKASEIIAVCKYFSEDGETRTRIWVKDNDFYVDMPIDEIMTKIAEALND